MSPFFRRFSEMVNAENGEYARHHAAAIRNARAYVHHGGARYADLRAAAEAKP